MKSLDKQLLKEWENCGSKEGVCATSYGRDLSRGKMVHVGEAIGMISAQSIGEPGTQLTMRTFHIGGAASSSVEQSNSQAPVDGKLKFENIKLIEDFLIQMLKMHFHSQQQSTNLSNQFLHQ